MTDKTQNNYFKDFLKVDIKGHIVEKKIPGMQKTLSYLSWSYAWAEVKKADPTATFKIYSFENNLPYVCDPKTGYMVFTEVTVFNNTLTCFLPVMNGANKAMKDEPYTYTIKGYNGAQPTSKTVNTASMMDINKTIMRCLVKNIALHGLGLNIYAGEDLTDDDGVEGAQSNGNGAQNNPPNKPAAPSPTVALQVTTAEPVGYNFTDVTVDKPICPHCGKLMYVTKFPDKKTGDYYLYCCGSIDKTCKYTCSSNGNARSDVAGKFV